jgi:ABC-type transport system involved in cytochrome bd biosynthesis fused ATPase/permease subunit
LQNADLLLLDEPFTGLNPDIADKMILQLRQQFANKILIVVSHQPLPTHQYSHQFFLS